MIPAFDPATGFLPIGIHDATWQQFIEHFGHTQHRRDLINGLYRAAKDLQSCGCRILYVDGGFTTNKKLPPKDIDVCWDIAGVDLLRLDKDHSIFFDRSPGRMFQKFKYGCEFFQADKIEGATGKPWLDFFQQHHGIPKGILRINIETI